MPIYFHLRERETDQHYQATSITLRLPSNDNMEGNPTKKVAHLWTTTIAYLSYNIINLCLEVSGNIIANIVFKNVDL
jgi:hypothetical protein